jgi:hypothetical protein
MGTTSALKKMDGIETIEIDPNSRDEQYDRLVALASTNTKDLTIVTAGTGSGKARCIAGVSNVHMEQHNNKALAIVNSYTAQIRKNIDDEHKNHGFMTHIVTNETDLKRLTDAIDAGLSAGQKQAVIYYGVSHSGGEFTKLSKLLNPLYAYYKGKGIPVLAQVDEIHRQITQLTGGINGSIYRHKTQMSPYYRVIRQKKSLNTLDQYRKHSVRAILWSATTNHIIASKLGALGYDYADILSVNVKPIPSLYPLVHPHIFTPNLKSKAAVKEMLGFMREEERGDRHILIIASSRKWLKTLREKYKEEFGEEMSSLEITADTNYSDAEITRRLSTVKYVLGIDKISVGFNLATYTDTNFGAVFMCKKCADRVSQPLSGNPNHKLHCWLSAGFIQAIARGRDSECTLYVSSSYDGVRLIDALERVSEIVAEAAEEAVRYGPVGKTQAERIHHQIYVALCQNIRKESEDTPTVCKLLEDLYRLTGRHLDDEYELPDCDHMFWRLRIAELWAQTPCPDDTSSSTASSSGSTETVSGSVSSASGGSDSGASSGGGSGASSGGAGSSSGGSGGVSSDGGSGTSSGGSGTSSGGGSGSGTSSGGGSGASPSNPSQFTSGSGQRDGRVLYEEEYILVKARACGNCAACSDTAAEPQVAHVYEHAAGGSPTADNMVLMCRGCHGMYDEPALSIHPRMTGYWCKRKFCAFPDRQQFAGITMANLETRLRYDLCKHGKNPSGDIIAYAEAIMPSIGYVFHPFPA